jgi:hypothetical protein
VKLIRVLLGLLSLLAAPCVLASTIHVPKDQPTIQAGINRVACANAIVAARECGPIQVSRAIGDEPSAWFSTLATRQ